MKKNLNFLRRILPLLILVVSIQVEFGVGYQSSASQSDFEVSDFFTSLQSISGEMLKGPSFDTYQKYQTFLSAPTSSLKFQTYEYPHQMFRDTFTSLLASWTPIQLIIEDQKYQQFSNPLRQLETEFSGFQTFQVKSDKQMGTTYVHSKISLSDTEFRIQSANLTKSSYESNREHFFHSSDPEMLASLHQLFDNDWEGDPLQSSDFHSNLVVCPTNCRAVVEALLYKAETSITIQTQYIFDPEILKILRHQSTQLDLKIIVADTISNQELVSYFGPWVARKLTSNYNHTKMILVDDKYLLLGSMNLSDNSIDNNREIWLLLIDEQYIQLFKEWFQEDWRENTK